MNTAPCDDFSQRILTWFKIHGRHDLPWQQWQNPKNPYPVWISEIMLQQTQVATVIPYFHRFMARFDSLDKLAQADLADVLALWSGLGYYARAKNLHKAANQLTDIINQTGDYPKTVQEWQALSGIGRSTAGAIVAMGLGRWGVICDGNVKRVLTRHFGIAGNINHSATDKQLWQLASQLTPQNNSDKYAQAIMDLGATVCTRSRPKCSLCPIANTCHAFKTHSQSHYPVKNQKTTKATHRSIALMIRHNNQTLWLNRSQKIWQHLWCLPLIHLDTLTNSTDELWLFDTLNIKLAHLASIDHPDRPAGIAHTQVSIIHTLTHFHWQLDLAIYTIDDKDFDYLNRALPHTSGQFMWLNDYSLKQMPIPVGMQKLLNKYNFLLNI